MFRVSPCAGGRQEHAIISSGHGHGRHCEEVMQTADGEAQPGVSTASGAIQRCPAHARGKRRTSISRHPAASARETATIHRSGPCHPFSQRGAARLFPHSSRVINSSLAILDFAGDIVIAADDSTRSSLVGAPGTGPTHSIPSSNPNPKPTIQLTTTHDTNPNPTPTDSTERERVEIPKVGATGRDALSRVLGPFHGLALPGVGLSD